MQYCGNGFLCHRNKQLIRRLHDSNFGLRAAAAASDDKQGGIENLLHTG